MDTSAATELAATLQSAHIKSAPSAAHDLNPSTAASQKIPVSLQHRHSSADSLPSSPTELPSVSAHPIPRASTRSQMPPLPDLRFEQSYLASIPADATRARVLYITLRDHLLAPLLQGFAWSLLLLGWRHWNRGTKLAGHSVGARIRRWWWRVNHWDIPGEQKGSATAKSGILDEGKVREFYQAQMGAGGD